MLLGERVARVRNMAQGEVETEARKQFEGHATLRRRVLHPCEQAQRRIHVRHRGERGFGLARPGMQPQHGRGDHAQRALGADKKLLQVVAGVVLAQPAQPVPQAAVGQHRLQSQDLFARRAVAQHVQPARIGGEVAADLAGAFRRQAQREQPVRVGRGLLEVGEDAARFHGHGVVARVQLPDAVEPARAQDDAGAVGQGRAPAHEAGVPALGHHGHARGGARGDDLGERVCRARLDEAARRTVVAFAPVDEARRQGRRVGDHVARAHDGRERGGEVARGHGCFGHAPGYGDSRAA